MYGFYVLGSFCFCNTPSIAQFKILNSENTCRNPFTPTVLIKVTKDISSHIFLSKVANVVHCSGSYFSGLYLTYGDILLYHFAVGVVF